MAWAAVRVVPHSDLLHRYERLLTIMNPTTNKPETGRVVFAASLMDLAPKTTDETFQLHRPADYKQEEFKKPVQTMAPNGLLAVGSPAPDWELKTPDGKAVSLKSLRGKIVVMDFWASWCGPCKMAMPGVQKLHERYKDKPVAIFGIDHAERFPFDPAAYYKEKNYTYGLLVDGNSVAYKYHVTSIPCFYAIDPEGKIIFSQTGFDSQMETRLVELIDEILKKK